MLKNYNGVTGNLMKHPQTAFLSQTFSETIKGKTRNSNLCWACM